MAKAIMSLCDGAKIRVRVGSTYLEEFELTVGVNQGSVLSPLLFAMVVDDITENARRNAIKKILCADDLVLISKNMEDLRGFAIGRKN